MISLAMAFSSSAPTSPRNTNKRPTLTRWSFIVWGIAGAQLALAGERDFCQVAENCVPDGIHIRFGKIEDKIHQVRAQRDDLLTAYVVLDVKSTKFQGWSYGVRHDTQKLELLEATHEAPELFPVADHFFYPVTLPASGSPPAGFIQGILLSLFSPRPLPVSEHIAIAKATYKVISDLDLQEPTLIQFANDLTPPNSPPTKVNFTIDGKTRQPRKVIDGEVRGEPRVFFKRGDGNGDGRVNVSDAIVWIQVHFLGASPRWDCDEVFDADNDNHLDLNDPISVLGYLFLGHAPLPEPFQLCGRESEADALSCDTTNCESAPD